METDSRSCPYLHTTLDCHRLELSLPLYHLENLQNYYIDLSCTGVCTKWEWTPGVVVTFTPHHSETPPLELSLTLCYLENLQN